MKTIKLIAGAICAAGVVSFGATPTEVWEADDTGTLAIAGTAGAYSITAPASSDLGSTIDLTSTNPNAVSILIKYSGLAAQTSGYYTLATVQDTSTSQYVVGARNSAENSTAMTGYYAAGTLNAYGVGDPSLPEEGYALFTYNNGTGTTGTGFYTGSSIASLAGSVNTGLKWTGGPTISKASIGGPIATNATASVVAWPGVEIKAVALFVGEAVTPADVAQYLFPSQRTDYDYVATVTSDSTWDQAVWSPSAPDPTDLADKRVYIDCQNGANLFLPAQITGGVIDVGSGALTNAPNVEAVLQDVTINGKIAAAGLVKTDGVVSLSGQSVFGEGSTLEIAGGTTTLACADQGVKGDLIVRSTAILQAASTDAIWYYDHSATIDIYGELAMGSYRWSLKSVDYHFVFNLYGGASVTGEGDGRAAIDIISGGTFNINAKNYTSAPSNTVVINAPIRVNAKTQFAPESGIELLCNSPITQNGTSSGIELNHTGAGTVVLAGSVTQYGNHFISGGGILVYQNVNDASALEIGVKNNSTVILRGGTDEEPFYFSGNAVVHSGAFKVEEGSVVRFPAWLRTITVEEKGKVQIVETLGADGTAKVMLGENATIEDSVTLLRADETVIADAVASGSTGAVTFEYTPSTSGQICWLDFEFNNDRTSSGAISYTLSGSQAYESFQETINGQEVTTECMLTRAAPWSAANIGYPTEWSAAIRCTVPENPGNLVVAFGTKDGGLVGLAKGANDGEVDVVYTTGNSQYQVAATARVASPTSTMHLYVFTKTAAGIDVYCDNVLVNSCAAANLSFGGAFQIGSVHGSMGSTGFSALSSTDGSKIDFMRLYYGVVGPNLRAALSAEYPYVSNADTYSRTVSADGDWSETGAWTYTDADEQTTTVDKPAADGIVYVTVDAAAEMAVNLDSAPNYEELVFNGAATLAIEKSAGSAKLSAASVAVNCHVTANYDAVDFSASRVSIATGGSLTFDFEGYPFNIVSAVTEIQLTGIADAGLNIGIAAPQGYENRISIQHDGTCYKAVIQPRSTPATLYWTPSTTATLNDGTQMFDTLIEYNGTYYAMGNSIVPIAGDTVVVIGTGTGSAVTLANTGKLANIQVVKGKVEFVNSPSDFTDAVTASGAVTATPYENDAFGEPAAATLDTSAAAITLDAALGDAAFGVAADWTGTVVLGYEHSSGSLNLNNFGNANSRVVVNGGLTGGYLQTASDLTIAPAVELNSTIIPTDALGSAQDSAWGNATVFTRLSGGSGGALNMVKASSDTRRFTCFEIQTLDNYAGSLKLGVRNKLRIGKIVLDSAPADGVYANLAIADATAAVENLLTTPVFIASSETPDFTGLAYDETAGGLVKALAAIGSDTYATIDAAVAAANAANTAQAGTVAEIALLNGAVVADAAALQALGWTVDANDSAKLVPYVAVVVNVETNSALGGTITIDSSSTWYSDYMAGHAATDTAANGMTYGVCYALGLDPTDADAEVGAPAITIAPDGTVSIDLATLSPNVTIYCQLQSLDDLSRATDDTAWQNEGSPVAYGTGALTAQQGTDPTKYYRVVLSL